MGLFSIIKDAFNEREYECYMKCHSCKKFCKHYVKHTKYSVTDSCKRCGAVRRYSK